MQVLSSDSNANNNKCMQDLISDEISQSHTAYSNRDRIEVNETNYNPTSPTLKTESIIFLDSPDPIVSQSIKSQQHNGKDNNEIIHMNNNNTRKLLSPKDFRSLEQIDADLSFLHSMLPEMKSMSQDQKRKFKIGVLTLTEKILYSKYSSANIAPMQISPQSGRMNSRDMTYYRPSSSDYDLLPTSGYEETFQDPTAMQYKACKTYQQASKRSQMYKPKLDNPAVMQISENYDTQLQKTYCDQYQNTQKCGTFQISYPQSQAVETHEPVPGSYPGMYQQPHNRPNLPGTQSCATCPDNMRY